MAKKKIEKVYMPLIDEGMLGYWECLKTKIKNPEKVFRKSTVFVYREYKGNKKCPATLAIKLINNKIPEKKPNLYNGKDN